MGTEKGWISLDRAVFDHWIKPTKPFTKFEAWVNLIAMANHSPNKFYLKGQLIEVERGQQARSMVTLSNDWGWSRDKVKRFCKTLESDGMITIQTSHLTSIITICNYNEKQQNTSSNKSSKQSSNKSSNQQQTDSKQVINNNDNNENNDNKNTSSGVTKGKPEYKFNCTKNDVFHVYSEDIEIWKEAFPAVDIDLSLKQMNTWLISNPTKIKTKRGMPKFINGWLGREQNKGGNRASKSGQKPDWAVMPIDNKELDKWVTRWGYKKCPPHIQSYKEYRNRLWEEIQDRLKNGYKPPEDEN